MGEIHQDILVDGMRREVNVEALPMEVPDRLELDISTVTIGDSLRVADIVAPESVKLLDDPDSVVLTVTPPTNPAPQSDVVR